MKRNEVKQLTSLLAVGYLMLTISNSFAVVITNRIIATQKPKQSSTASVVTPTTPTVPTTSEPVKETPAPKAAPVFYSWPATAKTFTGSGTGPLSTSVATAILDKYTEYLTTNKNMAALYLYAMVDDVRTALATKRDLAGDAFERNKSHLTLNYRFKNDVMRDPLANFINAVYAYLCGVGSFNMAYPLYTQVNFDGVTNNASFEDIRQIAAVNESGDLSNLFYHAEFRLAKPSGNTLSGANPAVNTMKKSLRVPEYTPKTLVKGTDY